MKEYFFPQITDYERLCAAFVLQNIFLVVYGACRVMYMNHVPTWVMLKKKESLRFIRDAYRAGCALRERRYRMLLTRPSTPFARVCQAEVRPATRRSPRHRIKCNSRINEGSKCVG